MQGRTLFPDFTKTDPQLVFEILLAERTIKSQLIDGNVTESSRQRRPRWL